TIFISSLADHTYLIGHDGNYEPNGGGAPWENPREMFASLFATYVMYPQELMANISDPDTPASVKANVMSALNFMKTTTEHRGQSVPGEHEYWPGAFAFGNGVKHALSDPLGILGLNNALPDFNLERWGVDTLARKTLLKAWVLKLS